MADFKRNIPRESSRSPGKSTDRRGSDRSGGRDSGRFNRRDAGSYGGRDSGRFNRRDAGSYGRRDSRDFGSRDSGGFNQRGSDRPERTIVTCDSCKKKCEVPFKPSSDKPVYCSDCFKKESPRSDSGSRSRSNSSGVEFAGINQKLDKIMKMLGVE